MPLIDTRFQPLNWLSHAHAQTVAARYCRKPAEVKMRLSHWTTPDNDFLRVHHSVNFPDAPIVLISHGLEGSQQSTYVLSLLNVLQKLNWNSIVFEHRSCGGEMNLAKRLYHSGETEDLAFVVDEIQRRWPGSDCFLVGYSLGGNQIAKWLGEVAERVPSHIKASAVVSVPFNLTASAQFMDTGLRKIYVKHFLKKLIPKAIAKEKQYPGCLDVQACQRAKTFKEFDHSATAPLHGFQSAADYYEQVGCGQFLDSIQIPSLFVSAHDDPFNPGHTIPVKLIKSSSILHGIFPEHGGHVGFLESKQQRSFHDQAWLERQILDFFQQVRGI